MVNASRYVLCRAREMDSVAGLVLPGPIAERVIAGFMRADDDGALRRFHAEEVGDGPLQRVKSDQVLAWFARELGSSGPGPARLVLIERGSWSGNPSSPATGPTEAQHLVKAVSALGEKDWTHRGRVYRLAHGFQHDRIKDRHLFEAVPASEAKTILTELSIDTARSTELRALLVKAVALASGTPRSTPAEQIVLLRRQRFSQRPQLASVTATTPSQLKKAKQTEWVEVRFVDDSGEPIANEPYQVTLSDGSTRQGSLDGNGIAYLSGIANGICEVSFPNFKPRLAG
jgi:hypothetical protein